MKRGVLLYGPPASGKDTITAALIESDTRFQHYQRLKVGGGRTTGYRMTTADVLDGLTSSGQIIWENARYDARYAVDRPELEALVSIGQIPVVHLGQAEAIDALRAAMPEVCWIAVELWCPLPIAEARIRARSTDDTPARLAAWEATDRLSDQQVSVRIDTSQYPPLQSAGIIRDTVEAACHSM